jgi:hypothetical protein
MARIGRRGRLWLRAFHIFFMGLWLGGIISGLVILAFIGSAQSDGALQAMYKIVYALGSILGPVGGPGTVITGVLLSWLTPWGFFKHKWVVYTLAGTILSFLFYFPIILPLIIKLVDLVDAGGLGALQNPEYISAWNRYIIFQTVYSLLIISIVFVSVIKPWDKRERAEASS